MKMTCSTEASEKNAIYTINNTSENDIHSINNISKNDIDTEKNKEVKTETTKEEKGVTLELSEDAKLLQVFMHNMENIRESNESANEATVNMGKIMEIARRIAKGHKVPAKDEMKLLEYSSEMYQTAKAAAALAKNKEPKKYKSLFEDEEEHSSHTTEEVSGWNLPASISSETSHSSVNTDSAESTTDTSAGSSDTTAELSSLQ